MRYSDNYYRYRRAVRNLQARHRRLQSRWGSEKSSLARRDLEKTMDFVESQIQEYGCRLSYYRICGRVAKSDNL